MGPGVSREYKDRLFNFLFGSEENKGWTLSLYNAVNRSAYTDASQIQITTIREVMYLSMHNDISFLISDEMDLYEQQSTFNPNMPLRQLQYASNLYEKYITEHKMNKYGSRRLALPAPKLVVFYNGTLDQEDETLLRLSDLFSAGSDPDIEVRVRMININHGHSREILGNCEPLQEYSWLVDRIRKKKTVSGIEQAVDQAIEEMPQDFVIKPFLDAHRAEVRGMLLTEYNEAETMELFREEGRQEGRQAGLAEGFREAMFSLAREGLIPVSVAASRMGISEEAFRAQMEDGVAMSQG